MNLYVTQILEVRVYKSGVDGGREGEKGREKVLEGASLKQDN